MSICNTTVKYGKVTKSFHFITAILIIGMLIVGSLMGDIGDKGVKGQVYMIHKLTGLLILAVGVLFVLWSTCNKKPVYPLGMKCWEKALAKIVQLSLYALIIAMPLSGWVLSSAAGHNPNFFGLFEIPMPLIPHSKMLSQTAGDLHYYFAWSLFWLITLHVLGALKHHFIDRNNVMKRMFS